MDPENDGHPELMGTERMRDALDFLERWPQLTWEDVCDMVTVGIVNPDEKRLLFRAIEVMRERGVAAPRYAIGLEGRVRAGISDSFQHTEKTGGLTAVASMVFNRHRGEMTWRVMQDGPHILAANFREGQFGWISGRLGTGKTDTACSIMEQWIDLGFVALSNIKTHVDGPYAYVQDAKAMLLEIARILEDPMPDYWLMVFDELFISGWSTAQASTSKDKELDGFARTIRKLGGNLLVVEQLEKKVPTTIQELATSRYFCHRVGGGVVTVDLRGPYRHFNAKFEDFPKTNLEYETKDFAFFPTTEVVDFDGLYQALAKVDPVGFSKTIRAYLRAK